MKGAALLLCGVSIWAGFTAGPRHAVAQETPSPYGVLRPVGDTRSRDAVRNVKISPVDVLPVAWHDAVTRVMQQPTLAASSPADSFAVNDELYAWLLDHPDRVALAWRRLRVPAVEITPLGDGRFSWRDGQGSELIWQTVSRTGEGRIWYAEGKMKPGPLLPMVPVRAVAQLRHEVTQDPRGRTSITHRLEAYLQTDSRFAALVTRLLGPAAPKMAEDGAEQLLHFFSGMARYLDEHPDRASKLLAEKQ